MLGCACSNIDICCQCSMFCGPGKPIQDLMIATTVIKITLSIIRFGVVLIDNRGGGFVKFWPKAEF